MWGDDKPLISVGFYKGQPDFRISAEVEELALDEMGAIREMITVAIGTMEDMFRRAQEARYPAAQQEAKP